MSKPVDHVVVELSKLMVRTLRALGEAGPEERERACEFAGQAWALLHEDHADAAERMNGVLHFLTGPRFAKTDGANGAHPWLPAPATLESEAEVAAYYEEVGAKAAAGADFDMEVRHLIPADRHTLIIDAFNKLSKDQGFVLVNDHDPKPLYYQFAFEYADRFTWDPIEEGPEVWRVRIGRR